MAGKTINEIFAEMDACEVAEGLTWNPCYDLVGLSPREYRRNNPDVDQELHVHSSVLENSNRKFTNVMNAMERR